MSEIVLNIKGVSYPAWPVIEIQKSMDFIAGAYGAISSDIFRGNTSAYNIRMGDECVIDINDQEVMTGYIEKMKIEYRQSGTLVELGGRGKTGDLVDCPFIETPNEWKNQTVFNLIRNLCTPFSIDVVIDDSATTQANKIVETFSVGEGELVFDMIAKLVRDHSMLAIDKGDGKITLTQVTTSNYANDAIMLGGNAFGGILDLSDEKRFSKYVVKGQGIGSDNKTVSDWVSPAGQFDDDITSRYRPTLIYAETATNTGRCQDRAKWEARISAGKSRLSSYEVRSWTQSNGDIWDINQIVTIRDEFINIEKDMLIWAINYIRNEEDGEMARIYVTDKTTYQFSDNPIKIKSDFDR
jgi:prophage tail gpP-like protein